MAHQSPTNPWKNITVDNPASFLKDTRHISDSSDSTIFFDEEDNKSEVNFPGVTKTIYKIPHDKKKYHHISNEARTQLIDAIENKNQKIKLAAKTLGINYSSAKSIYQVFKREGRSDKKVFKRRGFKEENCPQDESSLLNLTTEPFSSDKTEEAPPIEQPDSLMALRDRLLASRKDTTQNLNAFKLSLAQGDYTGSYNTPFIYSQASVVNNTNAQNEFKHQQQFEPAKINPSAQQYVSGQQLLQQPLQQAAAAGFIPNQGFTKFLPQGLQGQTIYVLQPQMMSPMMMPSSQIPLLGNVNAYVPQGMPVAGQMQTININQPIAKNMNIQTLSMPTTSNKSTSFNPLSQMTQMAPQMQIQQPQYYSVGFVNPMMNQMGGFQPVQQKFLMVPQGNLMPVNGYSSQMTQNNIGFSTVSYLPSYQSQQANSLYDTQTVDDSLKVKLDSSQESSLSTETPASGSFSVNK